MRSVRVFIRTGRLKLTRLTFLGIFVSTFILAAAGQVFAAIEKDTIATPDNLTDMQKNEWDIGKYSGWLRLCGYGSKASQISSFMKKSPYFRKAESKMTRFDGGVGCNSSNEILNQILGEKEEWDQYLDITYSQQANKSIGPFDGLWTGLGESESGNCQYRGLGRSFLAFEFEILVREQEITGHIKGLRNRVWNRFSVNVSIQGTANENGEFDLQVGINNLSADLVLRGRLPKEGDQVNGKWNAPNCHGKLTLNRDFRVY